MKKLILTVMLVLPMMAMAQQAVATAGGGTMGASGSVYYTIGQPACSYATDGDNSIVEGMQQPYDVVAIYTEVEVVMAQEVKVFPNPTTDAIRIRMTEEGEYSYTLYSMSGATLCTGKWQGSEQEVNMHSYATGTYILKLRDGANKEKNYQIIKK